MFEKLTKLHLDRCSGFFLASWMGVTLGVRWVLEALYDGGSDDFGFAPGIVFCGAAFLAWAKACDKLICEPLCSDESSMLMSLPVSEETSVDSKVMIGTICSFIMYLCCALMALCMAGLKDGLAFTFTSIGAMFVEMSYGAWEGAVSIGVIPIMLLLEQILTSLLLIMVTLKCRNHRILSKFTIVICMVILGIQVLVNVEFLICYKEIAAAIPMAILEFGIVIMLAAGIVLMRKCCIHYLQYRYDD